MKTMLASDLLTARGSLLQLLGICAVIGVIMCYAMETTIGGVAAIAAMCPFMYLFTVAALDEQNGWERFRLTLPISRRQVVFGRYASLLVVTLATTVVAFAVGAVISFAAGALSDGQPDARLTLMSFEFNPPALIFASTALAALVILTACAVALPLIARFGMTKATRFVPLVFVMAIAAAVGFLGTDIPALDIFITLELWTETGNWGALAGAGAIVALAVLTLYMISAFVAAKLYEQREL